MGNSIKRKKSQKIRHDLKNNLNVINGVIQVSGMEKSNPRLYVMVKNEIDKMLISIGKI